MSNSTTGLQPNIAGLLCYVVGWITGLVFILIEQKDGFVRFHAMQSIITFGSLTLISLVSGFIPFLGAFVAPLLSILGLILWIILMIKAFQNQRFKLPFVGDLAEQYSRKNIL